MKTSLVLSAFNGERYVTEQLDSLSLQSRPIDEVIISDDCSTDDTPSVVREYIEGHRLENWSLLLNAENQGWKHNFHKLIARATGDLVFLCDQDDVWRNDKVEIMTSIMESRPDIDVLACLAEPFYEKGSQKTTTDMVSDNDGPSAIRLQHIDEKAVYVQRPGCTYCVRASFIRQVEPYWDEGWAHDAVLWCLSEVKGSLALIDKSLVHFRRHEGNASARGRMTCLKRIADLRDLVSRVDLMERFGGDFGYLTSGNNILLEDMRKWLEARISFLERRNLHGLRVVVSGRQYYLTSKGMPVDLALAMFRGLSL